VVYYRTRSTSSDVVFATLKLDEFVRLKFTVNGWFTALFLPCSDLCIRELIMNQFCGLLMVITVLVTQVHRVVITVLVTQVHRAVITVLVTQVHRAVITVLITQVHRAVITVLVTQVHRAVITVLVTQVHRAVITVRIGWHLFTGTTTWVTRDRVALDKCNRLIM